MRNTSDGKDCLEVRAAPGSYPWLVEQLMEAALPPELNIPWRWAFSDSLFPDQLEDVRLVFLPNDVERGEVASFAGKAFSPSSDSLGWDARGGLTAPLANVWLAGVSEVSKGWVVSTDADTSDEFET